MRVNGKVYCRSLNCDESRFSIIFLTAEISTFKNVSCTVATSASISLQSKLDEERLFYEKQLKASDESFRDLEARLKEYDELLLASGDLADKAKDDDDKLATIVETVSLEGQVCVKCYAIVRCYAAEDEFEIFISYC